jgi:hypothetical protein
MPPNYFVLTGLLGPSVALNLTELTGDLAQRETVLGDRHCLKANITAICDEFENCGNRSFGAESCCCLLCPRKYCCLVRRPQNQL